MTITPIQALYAMNSEFLHTRAKSWSAKLMEMVRDNQRRISLVYRTAYGRPPTPEELSSATKYLARPIHPTQQQALTSYLRVVLATNEFLFID